MLLAIERPNYLDFVGPPGRPIIVRPNVHKNPMLRFIILFGSAQRLPPGLEFLEGAIVEIGVLGEVIEPIGWAMKPGCDEVPTMIRLASVTSTRIQLLLF